MSENGYHPKESKGDILEEYRNSQTNYPQVIAMMSSKENVAWKWRPWQCDNSYLLKTQFSFTTSKSCTTMQVSKVASEGIYGTALLIDVKKVDVLLGDFNINVLSNETYAGVSNVLREYKLIVREPKHSNGGLMDHLYLMKQFLVEKHLKSHSKEYIFFRSWCSENPYSERKQGRNWGYMKVYWVIYSFIELLL